MDFCNFKFRFGLDGHLLIHYHDPKIGHRTELTLDSHQAKCLGKWILASCIVRESKEDVIR